MSKPKQRWWGYVQNVIRAYPETASATDRSSEEDKECAAVAQALEETARISDGALRLTLVRLVYFDHSHTLRDAAALYGVSFGAARRMQGDFIQLVGKNMGLRSLQFPAKGGII